MGKVRSNRRIIIITSIWIFHFAIIIWEENQANNEFKSIILCNRYTRKLSAHIFVIYTHIGCVVKAHFSSFAQRRNQNYQSFWNYRDCQYIGNVQLKFGTVITFIVWVTLNFSDGLKYGKRESNPTNNAITLIQWFMIELKPSE